MKLATLLLSCLSLLPVALSLSADARSVSNGRRLAQGLPPLRPRRLFSANGKREPTVSSTSSASSTTSSSGSVPTIATSIRAQLVGIVSGESPPLRRRQTVGSTVGYMNRFGQLVPITQPMPDDRFAITTDPEIAYGLYDPDRQGGTTVELYIGLSNDHSSDASRDQPINLSVDTGDYVDVTDCNSGMDAPAGYPPQSDSFEAGFYGETRVWQIDPSDGHISFLYVNTDGSSVPGQTLVTFSCPDFGVPSTLGLYVTANVPAFRDAIAASSQASGYTTEPDACTATEIELYYENS